MPALDAFRSARLTGHPPQDEAEGLYVTLFGDEGARRLFVDRQDWGRHGIAPWVLSHAGHDVGVGGFRIGFAEEGLELIFHFVPEVWGQGLASEFVKGALDFAGRELQEDRFFAHVPSDDAVSQRLLHKVGFAVDETATGDSVTMRLRRPPVSSAAQ